MGKFGNFIDRAIPREIQQACPVVQQAVNVATREATRSVANAIGNKELEARAAEQSNHFKQKLNAELDAFARSDDLTGTENPQPISSMNIEAGPSLESITQLASTVATLEANDATVSAAQNVRATVYDQSNEFANNMEEVATNIVALINLASMLMYLQAPASRIQPVITKLNVFINNCEAWGKLDFRPTLVTRKKALESNVS